MSRRKCDAPTARGTLCENHWDTCAHPSHKHRGAGRGAGVRAAPPGGPPTTGPGTGPEGRLSDSREAFNGLVSRASDAYGLHCEGPVPTGIGPAGITHPALVVPRVGAAVDVRLGLLTHSRWWRAGPSRPSCGTGRTLWSTASGRIPF